MLTAAYIVIALTAAYLATGLMVGLIFVLGPIERREPGSRGSYAFRALLLPGMALLWPLVLKHWQTAPPTTVNVRHDRRHGGAWFVVALMLLLVLAAALAQRASVPREPGSIRIGNAGGFQT